MYISYNILKGEKENVYVFLSRRISQLIYYTLGGLLMIPLFPSLASLFGIGTRHQVPFICPRCSQRHNSNLQDQIIFIIKNATCLDSTIKSERNFTARLKRNERTSSYFRILFISLQYSFQNPSLFWGKIWMQSNLIVIAIGLRTICFKRIVICIRLLKLLSIKSAQDL